MARLTANGTIFTVCLPRDLSNQVLKIADREFEKPTTVLRRLFRLGLQAELKRTANRPETSDNAA
jgi:hypothetical protein